MSEARAEPASITTDPLLHQARRKCEGLRILSTLPFHRFPEWNASVTTLAPRRRTLSFLWRWTGITDPLLIPRLLWRARRADAVLLNGGERVDLLYLALAGLAPWIRAPHLIVDAHWQAHGGLHGRVQRWLLELGKRVLHEVQPHSPEEIDLYRQHFGIPAHKLRPLPWSTSLTGYRLQRGRPRVDLVVSGGFSYRDYPTLFAAVRRCGLPLAVGLPASRAAARVRGEAAGCPHIRIVDDWSFEAYWQAVADARVFAMALTPGLNRCTADQTLLNAMALGTLVVATDSISSRLYIRDGENGFLVPEDDPVALADALQRAWTLDPADYRRITSQAMADVEREHREDTRLARTLLHAAEAAEGYRRSGGGMGLYAVWVSSLLLVGLVVLVDTLS